MDRKNIFEKVISTNELKTANVLSTDQADRFISYLWDKTVLSHDVTRKIMKNNESTADVLAVGKRILRVATEAVDDGVNVGAAFSHVSIVSEKFRFDWEISTESLEDNIEGAALEDDLARLMANQVGEDWENILIHGDTDATGLYDLGGIDGWRKRIYDAGHVVNFGGSNGAVVDRSTFNTALKAFPRDALGNRNALRFYTSGSVIQDYQYSVQQSSSAFVAFEQIAQAAINSAVEPNGPAGYTAGNAFGITLKEVPLFRSDYTVGTSSSKCAEIWLLDPKNLVQGIRREISITREYKAKKDTFEFTGFMRGGCTISRPDQTLVVNGIVTG